VLAFRVFINAVGPHFQANSSRFTVFKPPQDEPPPPTNLIEEFIRHEVPRLIRSQIEEKFSSTDNLELTRETLSTSMMTFIERAIDTSILTFKTTAAEEILPQGNPNTTGLLVNLALVTPQNAEGRVPEQQENSADQDLRIPNPTSLPTLYDSLKPLGSHAYQELQFGHLKRPLANQDDQFSQSNVQLNMNTDPNFEDFYLDPGLEPDWNWFTEVSQRLV
jgi:hypothetical protein